VQADQIAFGNSPRSDATRIGDLDQRHCFLRTQLDEWALFQPTLPVSRLGSSRKEQSESVNRVSCKHSFASSTEQCSEQNRDRPVHLALIT